MPTASFSLPDDTNWTGAEIKRGCRLASLLGVPLVQAAQNVVPVAVTAGDKIERLRQWASGRRPEAERAGVYSRGERADESAASVAEAGGELTGRKKPEGEQDRLEPAPPKVESQWRWMSHAVFRRFVRTQAHACGAAATAAVPPPRSRLQPSRASRARARR